MENTKDGKTHALSVKLWQSNMSLLHSPRIKSSRYHNLQDILLVNSGRLDTFQEENLETVCKSLSLLSTECNCLLHVNKQKQQFFQPHLAASKSQNTWPFSPSCTVSTKYVCCLGGSDAYNPPIHLLWTTKAKILPEARPAGYQKFCK